eukprot:3970806-Pyramimonas_sp.AAC.1
MAAPSPIYLQAGVVEEVGQAHVEPLIGQGASEARQVAGVRPEVGKGRLRTTDDSQRGRFFGLRKYFGGRILNSPVVERLNKGLMAS